MNASHLACVLAAAAALGACHRPVSKADAREAASNVASNVASGTRAAAATAGNQLADGWLTTKIQSKFVADRDIKASDVNVSSRDGVVTLTGRVGNDPMRSLAVAIAKNTEGVKQVIDRLSVAVAAPVASAIPPASTADGAVPTTGTVDASRVIPRVADDVRITTSIQAKYFLDDNIKGRHISVTTNGGVVTLRGDVGSEDERSEALLLARTTEGVARVEDSLRVTTPQSPE